jgi:formylglycine-generating enzyme required for sulfatase activity
MNKKGRPPRWDWLPPAFRRYADFFFGTVFLGIILALITQGPQQSLAFLAYARAAPLIFWPALAVLAAPALAGLVFNVVAVIERRRDPHRQRKQYLAAIDREYQYIPLVIDPKNVRRLPKIVYQRLRFLHDPVRPVDEPGMAENIAGKEIEDIDDVLERGQRSLMILGWPGGGKTTLLRHSMSQRAEKIADRPDEFLPVYLSLPLFAPLVRDPDAVANYLKTHEKALAGIEHYANTIQAQVQQGEAFLFLDGLDEVDMPYRDDILEWIRQQQRRLNLRGALIVGTRFTDYSPQDFLSDELVRDQREYAVFSEWVAQSMDHGIRLSLAKELLPVLVEQRDTITPGSAGSQPPHDPERFVTLIEEHPQGKLWGGNPLLFSLAAYVYVQEGELPSSRVTLYERSITALLAKVVRLRQQAGSGAGRESGIVREMSRVLAEVALRLYDITGGGDGASPGAQTKSFPERALVAVIEQIRDDLNLGYPLKDLTAWVVDSGTLAVSGPKTYLFRHPTYREYLAVLALARRLVGRNERLLAEAQQIEHEKRFSPAWTEPMRMLAGALVAESQESLLPDGQRLAQAWLGELREQVRGAAAPTCDEALELAVASLPEIPDIEAFAEQIDAAGMLDAWAAALLRTAQESGSPFFARFKRLAAGVVVLPPDLVRPALARLQTTLADDNHPDLQIAAAQALAGMGDLVVDLALLIHLLETGRDQRARVAAAYALATIERSDQSHPGHDVLRAMLAGSDSARARVVAEGLSGAGIVALPLMLVAVEPERDPEVRRLGAMALGGVGARARDALDRLSYDADSQVAQAALDALTKLGADRSQLASAISQQARQGADVSRILQELLPYALRQLGFTASRIGEMDVIVPPVCDVPAGAFLMGSDKQKDKDAYDDELPQHTVMLGAFQIGMYPVTVAEYACAVRANVVGEPPKSGSVDWTTQLQRLDHPVVCVSWRDVLAYVRWLEQVTGQPWRLPTEAEWEKAARGTDGRIYPWGSQWDKNRANTRDGGAGTTTPVGAYAERGDASPYGAHDQAGNVWEWTSSLFKKYKYNPDDGRENLDSTVSRVLRGGSWYGNPRDARAAFRNGNQPDLWSIDGGFRLACAAAGSS